jgi:hypothetical protein
MNHLKANPFHAADGVPDVLRAAQVSEQAQLGKTNLKVNLNSLV